MRALTIKDISHHSALTCNVRHAQPYSVQPARLRDYLD